MNLHEDRAALDRERPTVPPPERPETSPPPVDSDVPPEMVLDSDSLDIDALLPVAFDAASVRVAMGPDLADLLRAAEERLVARGGHSPSEEPDADIADVAVPDDVMALLDEPLEDDGAGTGGTGGSSAGGTGADRPRTMAGSLPTANGDDDDLEQALPRASDPPKETTGGRVTTAAGREDTPLHVEPARGSGGIAHSVTDEHSLREHSLRGESAALTRAAEDSRSRDRGEPALSTTFFDRGTPFDRGAPFDPGTPVERSMQSLEWGPPQVERVTPPPAHAATAIAHAIVDRTPAPATPVGPLPVRSSRPGMLAAKAPERGYQEPPPRTVERTLHGDGARFQTAKMVSPVAVELSPPTPSVESAARSRAAQTEAVPVLPSRVSHTEATAAVQSRAPYAEVMPVVQSRAAHTEAMPAVLGPGDAARALGRAIASRVSGAIVVSAGEDQRRIVLHDGDVVTAGSTVTAESLVAFLAGRGDLDRELVPRLGKLPAFGRHAGAALVANGYLGQDDLWPVLRAHAEWVIGRALMVEHGTCELESEPPARYKAEPSVFGGATGAEVLVESVQRVIAPETALSRLGGAGARLAPGARTALLGECALLPEDHDRIRGAAGRSVREVVGDEANERWSMLYALVCLDVLDALPAVKAPEPKAGSEADPLDEEAVRIKVRARLALVEEGDYFALLGVPRAATSYEIRRAYLDLRRTFEPARMLTAQTADLVDEVRLIVEVVEEAYEILRDAPRRERYRRAIETGPPK